MQSARQRGVAWIFFGNFMPEKTVGSEMDRRYQKTHTNLVIRTNQKPDRAYREKTAADHVSGSLTNRYRPDICFGTKVAVYIGICGRIKNLSKVQRQGRSGLNNEYNSYHCSSDPV